ncbi:hypothetical protein E2C01_057910 [Portunus trituberculatus]|uniref:Uncharacterized protein n=1 Tax=Portunus trituberculatus TaxID=210409 RepID=A0A5B7H4M7_PORTR|nr:hypothetical protein [Portunus trituberculatus]
MHFHVLRLLTLSGFVNLARATPDPQQKFPEDFYSGSNAELPQPTEEVSTSPFLDDHVEDFETSPVQTSAALQSNVDLRVLYDSLLNASRDPHIARQHQGLAGYTRTLFHAAGSARSLSVSYHLLWIIICGAVAVVKRLSWFFILWCMNHLKQLRLMVVAQQCQKCSVVLRGVVVCSRMLFVVP